MKLSELNIIKDETLDDIFLSLWIFEFLSTFICTIITVKLILIFQGFSRPSLLTKHPGRSEGYFVGKIGGGNPW